GDGFLPTVKDPDAGQVVFLAHDAKGVVVILGHEIGEHEDNGPFAGHVGEELQGFGQIGLPTFGGEFQKLPDDSQYVALSFFWRDEELHPIGKQDQAHLVVVLHGRKGQGGGNLGDDLLFELGGGPEEFRSADIDHEHHGQLPFLLENLDKGFVVAGGDIPVDAPDVIPILVLPDLTEGHAPALEGGMVLPPKDVVRKTPGLDLYLTY